MAELDVTILLLCINGFHVSRGDPLKSLVDQLAANPDVIPQNTTPINVSLSFKLLNIVEADEDRDQVEVVLLMQAAWIVPSYRELFEDFDFNQVSLSSDKIWIPDISVYNAIAPPKVISADRVNVFRGGHVRYLPSMRVRFICDLRNVYTPVGALCSIKVGSWTYHTGLLDLSMSNDQNIAKKFYSQNYKILTTTYRVNSWRYSCCADVYEKIELIFAFRKKDNNTITNACWTNND